MSPLSAAEMNPVYVIKHSACTIEKRTKNAGDRNIRARNERKTFLKSADHYLITDPDCQKKRKEKGKKKERFVKGNVSQSCDTSVYRAIFGSSLKAAFATCEKDSFTVMRIHLRTNTFS